MDQSPEETIVVKKKSRFLAVPLHVSAFFKKNKGAAVETGKNIILLSPDLCV